MANFFIDRPVFAWVISILIMLFGGLSIAKLPVSQFPDIAPVAINITSSYPGASAKTAEDTVTQVIEQKMKGIDGLRYMASFSDATGQSSITLTFDANTNADIAQVQVQNKLSLAMPLLPQIVQRQGIAVTKSSANFLAMIVLESDDPSTTDTDLCDYAAAYLLDPISRVEGVGEGMLFGAQYAMRVWLDPNRLLSFSMTPADVASAISAQNSQISVGQIGGTPAAPGQQINFTILSQTLLQSAEEFEKIILRVNADGSVVRLADVARVELGSDSYGMISRYNGKPASGIAIKPAPGANALATMSRLRSAMELLAASLPHGVKYSFVYDTTPFVHDSIEDVIKTLGEAIVLVFLIMLLFLQNIRATLIPTIAVPVVLLGTLGVLAVFGYSINMLTMFGMVLAIGLLIDDAIVVVENVERIMKEEGLSAKEATKKTMAEITGALLGIASVLSAVFIPMAFISGSPGVIYRQFSVTIVSAMMLSLFIAVVLTPALCATLLKSVVPQKGEPQHGLLGMFNRAFDKISRAYVMQVSVAIRRSGRMMVIYLLLLLGGTGLFALLPSAFLPDEDQGNIFSMVQLPPGATLERTVQVLKQLEEYFLASEGASVRSLFTIAGYSYAGSGQNTGMAFVDLKSWGQRKSGDKTAFAVSERAMQFFSDSTDATVSTLTPPAVAELGNASGFDFFLQDRTGAGHEALMRARDSLLAMATQNTAIAYLMPNGQDDAPQFQLDIDLIKAGALGLNINSINDTLSTVLGGTYVNDFIDRGRVKKVYIQGDAHSRMMPEDLSNWNVRNAQGVMVSFASFASGHWVYGSPRLERYNGLPSVELIGNAAPGVSTGEAMRIMEEMVKKLPEGIGIEWTGLSYQEKLSGAQAPALYAISIFVVFLCLAALYESWSVPTAVVLVVPLGIVGALAATLLRGMNNDIFFQVGLLTTIGLSAKNAILIIEFATHLANSGIPILKATLQAARLRLRPILMTSLAFLLGVLPMVFSSGAGAASQRAIGTGVAGGVVLATTLGVFFVPVFFVIVYRFSGRLTLPRKVSH